MPLRMLGALAGALFCWACYWSIRLAYADHIANDRSRPAIERAIRLAPGNPEYYVRLAEADPSSALTAMEKAVALDPLNSAIWIDFARIAEEHKDFQRAESCLLRAVGLDRTFAPRWLLAGYYFRRHDPPGFWPAVRSALATSYDDVAPLFDECWQLAPNPGTILAQAIPDRNDVLRQYLNYVLAKKRLDLAEPVASRVMEHAGRDDVPALLSYCDDLLAKNQAPPALEIWNSMSKKRLLDYPALIPENGASITNGGFEKPFLTTAFDWRLAQLPGVSALRDGTLPMLRLSFSGKQPETCEILSELVPLAPARKYLLSVRYETDEIEGDTGLSWRVLDVRDGADLLEGTGQLKGKERVEGEEELSFTTPAETQLARVALMYQRVLGTVRITGSISLRNVRLSIAK